MIALALNRHCEEPQATRQSSNNGTGLRRYARNDQAAISLEGGVG